MDVKQPETKYCDTCAKDINASNWAKHLKSKKHLNPVHNSLTCDQCDHTAASRQALYNHKQQKHQALVKKTSNFFCNTCQIEIRDKAHAKAHIRSQGHKSKIFQNNPEYVIPSQIVGRDKIDQSKKMNMIGKKKIVKKEAVKRRAAPQKHRAEEGYNVKELSELAKDREIPEAELDDVIDWLLTQDDGSGYNTQCDFDNYKKEFEEDKLTVDEKYQFIGWMVDFLNDDDFPDS